MYKAIMSFNESADKYENWYGTPLGEYVLKAELKGLNALLPQTGIGAEIGACTGIFAAHLKTDSRVVLCIDPSVRMLNKAHEKGLQAVAGTAELPPMRSCSLDFAFLAVVVEFLDNPFEALSSLRELLKPRSPIIVLWSTRRACGGKHTWNLAGVATRSSNMHASIRWKTLLA